MNYFQEIEKEITRLGFKIISRDFERPWGGFLVINESQAQDFANKFFDGLNIDSLKIGGKLSPKILIVNPNYEKEIVSSLPSGQPHFVLR